MTVALLAETEAPAREPADRDLRSSYLAELIREMFDRTFYLAAYPDIAAAGVDALEHFLSCGMAEGRSPHPLFDAGFYAAQMPEDATEPAFLHYLRAGSQQGLDPHPLFDTVHYIAQTSDRTLFGQMPLLHFIRSAERAGLSPNPLFDAAYYRRVNGVGDAFPRHPLLHYIETGWRQGCRAHPLFDADYYLGLRPDVASAGIDPLAHYLRQGWRETPSTHALFDAAFYRAALSKQPLALEAVAERGAIIYYALHAGRTPSPHPLFDRAFYSERHPQPRVNGATPDAFLHYLEHGLQANIDPHPLFDSASYLERYPDVAASGVPPLLHFLAFGALEGRDPGSKQRGFAP